MRQHTVEDDATDKGIVTTLQDADCTWLRYESTFAKCSAWLRYKGGLARSVGYRTADGALEVRSKQRVAARS